MPALSQPGHRFPWLLGLMCHRDIVFSLDERDVPINPFPRLTLGERLFSSGSIRTAVCRPAANWSNCSAEPLHSGRGSL